MWYYVKLCNFTKYNGGAEWYCGHPRGKELSCEHWKNTIDGLYMSFRLPLTDDERHFNKESFNLLPENISLRVTGEERQRPSHVGRMEENIRSWSSRAPRGYFMNNTWEAMGYKIKHITKEQLNTCLKNTTVILNGDSNLRFAFKEMAARLDCEISTGKVLPRWHHPLSCINSNNSLSVYWQIHGLPFHAGNGGWCSRSELRHVVDSLDEIPAVGRFVLMIHYNLHFTYHHYSQFARNMRLIRLAVERVLGRNPSVKLVLRGPHQAFLGRRPIYNGDLIANVSGVET